MPSDVSNKKNVAPFECNKCEKSYQNKHSLNRHIRNAHEIVKEDAAVEAPVKNNKKKGSGLPLTVCNICERFFITKEALDAHHSENHSDQVRRLVFIAICLLGS